MAIAQPVAEPPPPPWWSRAVAVDIVSSPGGSRVLVNGYRIIDTRGDTLMTPCAIPHMLPGDYVFELVADEGQSVRRRVTVGPDGRLPPFALDAKRSKRWRRRTVDSLPSVRIDARQPIPPWRSIEDRHAALAALFGRHARINPPRRDDELATVRVSMERFQEDALPLFAATGGSWSVERGNLMGRPIIPGVQQAMFLLPFVGKKIEVTGRVHSDAIFELSLHDPNCERFEGTNAVGRLHFGRMGPTAESDWLELSARESSPAPIWGIPFPKGPQDIELKLDARKLFGSVTVGRGQKNAKRLAAKGDPPDVVYVGFGSGVSNTVRVERLQITGAIDLGVVTTDVLVGMGESFWGEGRDVTLIYSAGTKPHRILVNGETIIDAPGLPVWMDLVSQLRRVSVTLRHGDTIGVEMRKINDESAFYLAGVDVETSRVVLATHSLVWRASASESDGDDWLDSFDSGTGATPRVTTRTQADVMSAYEQALRTPFPGLGIASLPAGHRTCRLKTAVR